VAPPPHGRHLMGFLGYMRFLCENLTLVVLVEVAGSRTPIGPSFDFHARDGSEPRLYGATFTRRLAAQPHHVDVRVYGGGGSHHSRDGCDDFGHPLRFCGLSGHQRQTSGRSIVGHPVYERCVRGQATPDVFACPLIGHCYAATGRGAGCDAARSCSRCWIARLTTAKTMFVSSSTADRLR
jgi:hypothetical protein